MSKVKRAVSIYDDYKFKLEFISLIRKAIVNRLNIDAAFIEELYKEGKESLKKTVTKDSLKKRYTELEMIDKDGNSEQYRWLDDGNVIKPSKPINVSLLWNFDLLKYLDKVSKKKHLSLKDMNIYKIAFNEALKRKLVLDVDCEE